MRYTEMTVSDLMTSGLILAKSDETILQASNDMRTADIRHLPVVDEADRLMGVLSNRDVEQALARPRGKGKQVRDIMSTDVLTVRPDTPAREATALMLDHKIGSLPVVNGEGVLVGIVTETDFLRIAHDVLGGELLTSEKD